MDKQEIYQYGLNNKQIKQAIKNGQVNVNEHKYTKSTLEIFKDNILTFFNFIVLMIALSLFLVQAYINMLFFIIIIINISVGIVQELIAKKIIENLSLVSASSVKVVRNNKEFIIKTEGIVLNDLMFLDANKQVNCDCKIISGEVEVNEALLTGEYEPIIKTKDDILLSGSFVVSGEVYAQVINVGKDNYAEQIAMEAKKHKKTHSELMSAMDKVLKLTTYVLIPAGIILFIRSFFFNQEDLTSSIVTTSGAIIGMLPIGVVLLITASLAVGIIKLGRLKVLTQELYAIESLSRVDLLCLDKTGTITQGKMSVKDVYLHTYEYSINDISEIMKDIVGSAQENNSTFQAMEDYFKANQNVEVVDQTNFSSQKKYSCVSFDYQTTYFLGAPEILIPNNRPEKLDELLQTDQRIILLAKGDYDEDRCDFSDLVALASIVIEDPLRTNVKETLDYFKQQEVALKIISGDNPSVVSRIAKKAGFEDYEAYLDISNLSDEELKASANKYTIFGRSSPKQKMLLIKEFKNNGHTVAMTGDGVNDVLALKEADCGIAMAQGSDAAKHVSQLVLIDSDFTNLPRVVSEGRRVVNNITKVASVYFVKTIYSAILTILCILMATTYPFNPIQITAINALIVGIPTFFITFEKNENKINNKFFTTTISNALPPALTIIFIIISLYILSNFIVIPENELKTMMYYVVAAMTYLTILKASYPYSLLNKVLLSLSFISFTIVMFFFSNNLGLATLSLINYLNIIVILVIAVYLVKKFGLVANRLIRYLNKKA